MGITTPNNGIYNSNLAQVITHMIMLYSGTLLNGHLQYNKCLDCISIDFNIFKPLQDTPLFRIRNTYFGPIQACAIVNNGQLATPTIKISQFQRSVATVKPKYVSNSCSVS